jgi:flavin-dependent dehydrogenase
MTTCVRVVVVGAGPAGLLAAGALAAYADEVVVLDRDRLPHEPVPREGVAQDRHWNRVSRRGVAAIEGLFPGFTAEAVAAGGRSEQGGLAVRRPLAEALMRRRVVALPHVRVKGRISAIDLLLDDHERRVRGVVVADLDRGSTSHLAAALVVDASGQRTRVPAWLARRGVDVVEERVRLNATFVTREFLRAVTSTCDPLVTRHVLPDRQGRSSWGSAAVVMAMGDRWLITLGGTHGLRPPTDLAGFTSYATDVCEPLGRLLRCRPAVGEAAVHRQPAMITRRIDRPTDFPAGLLLAGDAWRTLDPLEGSGLSTAADAAAALADEARRVPIEHLGRAWLDQHA